MVRRSGTYIIIGVFADRGSLMNPARLNSKDIRLIGAWYAPTQQYGKDLDFITSRKFRFEKIVTHKFGTDDAQEAVVIP
jgi:threonine dehydrogenase-like Zn-dependent dehydrogenase